MKMIEEETLLIYTNVDLDLINQIYPLEKRITKLEINKITSIFNCFSFIRKKRFKESILVVRDLNFQTNFELLKLFVLISNSENKKILDLKENQEDVSWKSFIIKDLPIFLFTIINSLYLLLKTYLYIKILLLRRNKNIDIKSHLNTIAYLRTDHWFDLKAGGSVGHIAGVTNAFNEEGYDIFMVSSDKLSGIKENIPIHIIRPSYRLVNVTEIPEIAYNYQLRKKAGIIFNQKHPEVIYQRYSLNNFAGILLSRKLTIPLVLEYNGSFLWMTHYWSHKLRFPGISRIIETANLTLSDLIVVVSKTMKDELIERGIPENKIIVNPNGVDTDKYNPDIDPTPIIDKYDLENKVVVGFIGTFEPWHGVEILAKSVKYVVERNHDVIFLFIGDGPRKKFVQKIIKNDNVEKYTIFTGIIEQKNSANYLAACDILVSPTVPNPDGSIFFGSPTKIFEYMALQKAIVASDIGQISEIIQDQKNGLLVKPGDQEDFNEGIMKLIDDEKLRKSLGEQARRDVFDYTWQKNVNRVIESFKMIK